MRCTPTLRPRLEEFGDIAAHMLWDRKEMKHLEQLLRENELVAAGEQKPILLPPMLDYQLFAAG